jgi:hypothetical protein
MARVAISLYSTEMHEKNYNQILNSDPKNFKKKNPFGELQSIFVTWEGYAWTQL